MNNYEIHNFQDGDVIEASSINEMDSQIERNSNSIELITQKILEILELIGRTDIPCESISFPSESIQGSSGSEISINVILEPTNTTDKVTFSSNNEQCAYVSNGILHCINIGECIITAKCGEHESSCAVEVVSGSVEYKYTGGLAYCYGNTNKFALTCKKFSDKFTTVFNEPCFIKKIKAGSQVEVTCSSPEDSYVDVVCFPCSSFNELSLANNRIDYVISDSYMNTMNTKVGSASSSASYSTTFGNPLDTEQLISLSSRSSNFLNNQSSVSFTAAVDSFMMIGICKMGGSIDDMNSMINSVTVKIS